MDWQTMASDTRKQRRGGDVHRATKTGPPQFQSFQIPGPQIISRETLPTPDQVRVLLLHRTHCSHYVLLNYVIMNLTSIFAWEPISPMRSGSWSVLFCFIPGAQFSALKREVGTQHSGQHSLFKEKGGFRHKMTMQEDPEFTSSHGCAEPAVTHGTFSSENENL